eukprot:CAMPEP_0173319394 /NCGR_PEP_ID=MMETSP1143-20121109/28200_1 /TAXON_ID=483371 /ORGANISM="non described non described, Strain CCMP2298" /LENGTH=187 /DNA_ID=CAMNT_0014262769 /DNA_START=29 /DNA_END=589 /DNA_ORIENTATION=+
MRASVTAGSGGYLIAASNKNVLRACRFGDDDPAESTLVFDQGLVSFDVGYSDEYADEYVVLLADATLKYGWTTGGRLSTVQKIDYKAVSTVRCVRWIAAAKRFLLSHSTGFSITEEVSLGMPVLIREPKLTLSSEIGALRALKASDVREVHSVGGVEVLLLVQSETGLRTLQWGQLDIPRSALNILW